MRVDRQRDGRGAVAQHVRHHLTGVPDASMSGAAVWRVSCNVMRGSSAAFDRASNHSETVSE